MASAIEKNFGIKSQLIKSSGGVFEVVADGKKIFSKKETGRFPEHGEVISSIKDLQVR